MAKWQFIIEHFQSYRRGQSVEWYLRGVELVFVSPGSAKAMLAAQPESASGNTTSIAVFAGAVTSACDVESLTTICSAGACTTRVP